MTIYIPMQDIMWTLFYLFGFASGILCATFVISLRNSAQQDEVERILRDDRRCIHFTETNKIPTVKSTYHD